MRLKQPPERQKYHAQRTQLMDFSWNQEEDTLYKTLLQAAQERFPEHPGTYWTREQWQCCGELGFLGLCLPTQYGGKNFSALKTALALEAFGRGCQDMGLVFSAAAHLLACCRPIADFGNEQLKTSILPGCCSGTLIAANAITEEEAGSDVFTLKTQARRDGTDYVLTGKKSYVSNGPVADLFLIYATTNPAHGYLGISAFLVDRQTPGLRTGEPFNKMGLKSTPACAVFLDDCRIPHMARIGLEGQGGAIFTSSMQWERTCLFAAYVGMMERQLERSLTYAKKRRQFGASIGKNQAIAHRLVNMKLRLESARLLLYRACWLLDQGQTTTQASSLAKIAVSEAAIEAGLDAIQIHGAFGFNQDAGIETMLRDAIPATLFSGTSEIHRNIIATSLGL
jgi:alkylation response protein AidB-like acyl-CoA dehydrogenase